MYGDVGALLARSVPPARRRRRRDGEGSACGGRALESDGQSQPCDPEKPLVVRLRI